LVTCAGANAGSCAGTEGVSFQKNHNYNTKVDCHTTTALTPRQLQGEKSPPWFGLRPPGLGRWPHDRRRYFLPRRPLAAIIARMRRSASAGVVATTFSISSWSFGKDGLRNSVGFGLKLKNTNSHRC